MSKSIIDTKPGSIHAKPGAGVPDQRPGKSTILVKETGGIDGGSVI